MNLLLLSKDDINTEKMARISGRRAVHIRDVLRLSVGDSLKTGIIDGPMGTANIIELGGTDSILVELDQDSLVPAPAPVPCKVVLAMPRPKMMRRVLQNLSAMGVKEIHLINCWRVEKSFWQTPWLRPEVINEQLTLGLEQAMDTQLPRVYIHKLFKPFVEDQLPDILKGTEALVAHPYAENPCPVALSVPSSLILGPEGGFTEYEVEKIEQAGAQPVSIGPRILRVETAVAALISRLYPG